MQQERHDQMFNIFLSFIIFYIQNKSQKLMHSHNILFYGSNLMYIQKYRLSIFQLIHQYIIVYQCYQFYLHFKWLGAIYYIFYLKNQQKEMWKIINNISTLIQKSAAGGSQTIVNCNLFYHSITDIYDIQIQDQKSKQVFFQNHLKFGKQWSYSRMYYSVLFLYAILKGRYRPIKETYIYLSICHALKLINKNSRQIILDRFYLQFWDNFQNNNKRREVFLKKKHIKYTSIKLTFKDILTMRRLQKFICKSYNRQTLILMQNLKKHLKRYHKWIGNLSVIKRE